MARIKIPRIVTGNSMGTTTTGITGLNEVQDMLKALQIDVPQMYQSVLIKYGDRICDSYKSKIHSVSGNLVSSAHVKRVFTEKTQRVSVIAGGRKAPHAHLVEFGHRQISKTGEVVGFVNGKPYMRTSFEQTIPGLMSELESILNNI